MEQSIVALIRPNLNLAQKEDQATHLIEHILAEPKRLKAMGISDDFYAKNIISHNGLINDYFATEYYVVRTEAANEILEKFSRHKDELSIDRDDFEKVKSTLIEELNDDKGEFIDLGEQISRAIYTPGSPSVQNTRDNFDSILNLSYEDTTKIFDKYNDDYSSLKMSFDDYAIDSIPNTKRNVLRSDMKLVELTHPWQSPGSVDTFIIVPIPKDTDLLINLLYSASAINTQFGILYDVLRNKNGLVYGVSIGMDYNLGTLDIYFSSSKENTNKVIDLIKKSLESYDSYIASSLEFIKGRIKLELELDWADVQSQSFTLIDRVVSGGYTETPKSLIERIDSITADDLRRFNRQYLESLNNSSLIIKRQHGKSLVTKIFDK